MIINTGGRTDTVQYYSDWLLRRFAEGFVLSRNPLFPHKITRYVLDPDTVDCVVFCSKGYAPILPRLHEIAERFNTYFFYTITAYGRDVEPGVPPIAESVEVLYELEKIVGTQRIVWRYDPVLLAGAYTMERHFETFDWLAARLAGHVDRCVFSFVEIYDTLRYNMPEVATLDVERMDALACGLGKIAARRGMPLQVCGTDADYARYGIGKSGCMTLDVLGAANGADFRDMRHKGMRRGCHCIENRDIGAYETCPNGCTYCYATRDHAQAARNVALHDPASPLLIGQVGEGDEIHPCDQKSFRGQPRLF